VAQGKKKKSSGATAKRYHHGDLRKALIDGALELISESNVEALSLRALARRVEVSYAAPYHHFRDKTQLLSEVAIEGFQRLEEEMRRQGLARSTDPRESLLAQGRAYLLFAVHNPSHYRVMFNVEFSGRSEYPEVQAAADACFEQLIADTQALLGTDIAKSDVGKIANVIWSTVHGAASLWNDGPMSQHLGTTSVDEFVEMITLPLANMIQGLTQKSPRAVHVDQL
jgi:AcrR family transcriptional regulator